jgi:hypothetical protein
MKKLLIAILVFTSFGFAQSSDDAKKDPAIYKINFTVMEVQNGQRSNVRNYAMFLPANGRTHSTRVGNRVPVPVGKDSGIQYMDVGLNMNCSITAEKAEGVVLEFNFDLGSLIAPEANASERIPVVRQLRQDGVAYLPSGKAVQIASADDINTTRTIVVEATATKVK